MAEDQKLVVRMMTGEEEEFSFDDTEIEVPEPPKHTIKAEITDPRANLRNDIEVRLEIRKTFDGKIMIFDHENIDIVIKPADHIIVTFPKDSYDSISYRTEERFFEYLAMKGAVDREDVEGGNIYGSLQSKYVDKDNPNQNTLQMIIFLVYKWMEMERPNFKYNKEMSKAYIDKLTREEDIEGNDPENIAKNQNAISKYRADSSYGGVYGANYTTQGVYYYE
jgi:hypothetical protein